MTNAYHFKRKGYPIVFLSMHPVCRKFVSQYTSYLPIFIPFHSVINRKQHEKYLYNQSSQYGKKPEYLLAKAHAQLSIDEEKFHAVIL